MSTGSTPPQGIVAGSASAYCPDFGYLAVDPEVRRVAEDAVGVLRDLGCTLETVTPAWANPQTTFWGLVAADSDLTGMRAMAETYGEEMSPHLLDLLQKPWTAEQFTDARRDRKAFANQMWRLMEDYDLLVTPILTTPPFPVGMQGPEVVDGRMVPNNAWTGFAFPVNLTGQPAASCPAGYTKDGLPVGMQIIGRHLADASVLAASAAFESARPWMGIWPPVVPVS